MNQLARIWASLSLTQRISLILAPVVVCAVVFGVLRWKHDNDFRVLYSGLAPEDASAVVQKIREASIEFRLDETGSTILVPSEHLAEARLAVAAAGLPRTGRIGFELFDRSNLGASDFAEQVNYRRALEGELERTVATLSEIEQARIHITFAKDSVFLDTRQPSKATVVLRLKHTAQLPQSSVVAIANLVASAVEGLSPEAVAIIDSNGRLLNRPHPQGDGDEQLAEGNLDYQRQLESELLAKINQALGPLLGADRFHASVNVDCDFTTSEENDESVDPSRSAVLTSQTTDESSGRGIGSGTPGTASNLPQPTARPTPTAAGLIRRTENATYQTSRTVKHTISPKGTIRRISTAVLVDQTVRWEGAGARAKRILVPPSADVLKGVHDVIAGITGYTEQRGDQITVETLPFENTLEAEPPMVPAPSKPAPTGLNVKQQTAIGGALVLILVAGVLIFVFARKRRVEAAGDAPRAAIASAGNPSPALEGGASTEQKLEQQISDNDAQQAQIESEILSRIKLPASTRKTDALVKHIRDAVQKDSVNATNVLRTWIAEADTKRTV